MQFGDKVIALFHLIRFCFIILYANIKLIFNKNIKGMFKKNVPYGMLKLKQSEFFLLPFM